MGGTQRTIIIEKREKRENITANCNLLQRLQWRKSLLNLFPSFYSHFKCTRELFFHFPCSFALCYIASPYIISPLSLKKSKREAYLMMIYPQDARETLNFNFLYFSLFSNFFPHHHHLMRETFLRFCN